MLEAPRRCKPALWAGAAAALWAGATLGAAAYQHLPAVPYAERTQQARTLELYLPAPGGSPAPLLAFVHASAWDAADGHGIGEGVARALAGAGIAVALVRVRAAPEHPYPAPQSDLASALAWLARTAPRHGYDAQRIVVGGHGAGGHIAALVALDADLRARHGVPAPVPAGAVTLGAPLDLERWAARSPAHARAAAAAAGGRGLAEVSPLRRVRGGAPPFLVLSAAREPRAQQVGARAFVEALLAQGNQNAQWLSVPGRDFADLARLDGDNPTTGLVAGFVRGAYTGELAERMTARRAWRDPPFSTQGFWRHAGLVREHRVDQRFYRALLEAMPGEREQLNGWALRRYFAIGLEEYLEAVTGGASPRDGWVAITNVNGERIVWRRREIAAYGPRIVIGLDDERNLFRIAAFYRMRMEYSWRPGARPPLMARPLGAFIYFTQDRPRHLSETIAGVTAQGVRLVAADPLAPLAALPDAARALVAERHNCVACHDLLGTGARAHHLTAMGGQPHGGFALPLPSYPQEVLRRFLFDQEGLAREFGITANVVAPDDARTLFGLLAGNAAR